MKKVILLLMLFITILVKSRSQENYIDDKNITEELNVQFNGLIKKVFPGVEFYRQKYQNVRPESYRLIAYYGEDQTVSYMMMIKDLEYLFRIVKKNENVKISNEERIKIYLILRYWDLSECPTVMIENTAKRYSNKKISANIYFINGLKFKYTFIINELNQIIEYTAYDLQTEEKNIVKIGT